jgi:DUF1707 SHOCT-like domain/Cell wall-active antibiotics response LiaF, C-terminal
MTNLPERIPPRERRASDADRERVAEILREAAAQGRLHLDELDERLAVVYAARTYADLEPVTADLPAHGTGLPPDERVGGTTTDAVAAGILGGFERKGRWVVPADFRCFAFWGGGEIDLREAQFAQREVVIHAYAMMGGIAIVVPEDVEVIVSGIGIMGGFDHGAAGTGTPGGPRVTVTGLAFWGGVSVTRRPPREEELRRREERRRAKLERRQARRLERGR